jgi:hypothetical protein
MIVNVSILMLLVEIAWVPVNMMLGLQMEFVIL